MMNELDTMLTNMTCVVWFAKDMAGVCVVCGEVGMVLCVGVDV